MIAALTGSDPDGCILSSIVLARPTSSFLRCQGPGHSLRRDGSRKYALCIDDADERARLLLAALARAFGYEVAAWMQFENITFPSRQV